MSLTIFSLWSPFSISSTLAGAALSVPFWASGRFTDRQILSAKWMSTLAMNRRIFNWMEFFVSGLGCEFEMVWIAARANLASVMQDFTFWDWSNQKLVNSAMGSPRSAIPVNPAIPLLFGGFPQPATELVNANLVFKSQREVF